MEAKKRARLLIIAGIVIYFASYVTRINFATVISEFITAEAVRKTEASIILTAMSITYGFGQLLSGYLGDRVNPSYLIFAGLFTSTLMNVLLPIVAPNIAMMTAVWAVNGLAQAFMWPPLIKILIATLSNDDYLRAMPLFGISTGGGTVCVYLVAPLLINLFSWRAVFVFSAIFGGVAAFAWLIASKKLLGDVQFDYSKVRRDKRIRESDVKIPVLLMIVIIIPIALQGALRDGITTWVPSFIAETFNISNDKSILTSVILPTFHILFNFVVYKFLKLMRNNVFASIGTLFLLLALFCTMLTVFGTQALWFALPLLAGISGFVHGTNSLQTCCIQRYFPKTGNVAFISGLLNSAVYVGSSVSTYAFAAITDNFGWNMTIVSWVIIAAVGALLSVLCSFECKRKGFEYE